MSMTRRGFVKSAMGAGFVMHAAQGGWASAQGNPALERNKALALRFKKAQGTPDQDAIIKEVLAPDYKRVRGGMYHLELNARDQGPPPLDTAVVTLNFVNGVSGTMATVRATPFYWRVHVFGTKGSAEVLDETTLVLRASGRTPEQIRFPAVDVLRAELDAFTDAIEGKRPFPVAEAEVLATLSAFEAALRSMASGLTEACDDR